MTTVLSSAAMPAQEQPAWHATRSSNRAAWNAVLKGDTSGLRRALRAQADPDYVDPTSGQSLLSQSCKIPAAGSVMAASLIEYGARIPDVKEPLAFELVWRCIIDDDVRLCMRLLGSTPALESYFIRANERHMPNSDKKIDDIIAAAKALEAIGNLGMKTHAHQDGLPAASAPQSSPRVRGLF